MVRPCEECQVRKMYARSFDMHFAGEDCWFQCEEYEHWKVFQAELNGKTAKSERHQHHQ